MFGNMGAPELFIVVSTILVLFGAKRLPEIAKGIGKGIKEFKREISSINDTVNSISEESKKWKS